VVLSDINARCWGSGATACSTAAWRATSPSCRPNAERLPFADNSFDCVTIGFGLRNVTDKAAALASMRRVLRPGGRLLVLEFSQPTLAPA
jgi:demethylmenaquinone methyltransferase/2-methoxy-6-polyprenyl-1,4-benzoquinol methylase